MRRWLGSVGSPVAWGVTLTFAALMVLWTIVTPAFRNPDEPAHVNSVLRLAEGGGWPAPSHAVMSGQVLRAKTLTGFSAVDGQVGPWVGGTLLPGVRPDIPTEDLMYFALYSSQQPTPPAERLPFPQLHVTKPVDFSSQIDQMTQHPPLYYAVDAAVVKATGALNWRFDRTLTLMRLVSVVLVAPLPLMAFSVVRRLTGRRRLADIAAVLPLGIPQLASLGGSVTNDAMVIALGGLLMVLLARVVTGDRSWRTLLAAAVVLGLALFTKGTMLAAAPTAGLAVLVGARRLGLSWRVVVARLAVLWGLALAVGGWWWVLNYVRYGRLQPSGYTAKQMAALVVDAPRRSVWGFAEVFGDKFAHTFWGTFGQLELPLPLWLVVVASTALLAAVIVSVVRRPVRVPVLTLLAFSAIMLVALFVTTYQSHLANGQFGGIQGRYLYGGLVAVLAAVAIGAGGSTREGGRAERALVPACVLLAGGMAAFGLWTAFHGYYVDLGWSLAAGWQRMIDWAGWPAWLVEGLAVGVGALWLGLVVLSLVTGRHDDPRGQPASGDRDEPGEQSDRAPQQEALPLVGTA